MKRIGRRIADGRSLSLFALGLLVFSILSGCASSGGGGHAGHAVHELPDDIETTASIDILPSFLDDYTETTREFYLQVPKYEHILKELNCYCGCMDYNDPHDSLYRCYIVGIDDKGVHWTNHGSACGICMMELRDAINMADEGKSLEEIKQHIDSTYGGNV